MADDVVVKNGRMPWKHYVIQGAISLIVGGIIPALAAAGALWIRVDKHHAENMALHTVSKAEIKAEAEKAKLRLDAHDKRLDTHDVILDKAFPRLIPQHKGERGD